MRKIVKKSNEIIMEKCTFKSVKKDWELMVKSNPNTHPFQYYDLSKIIRDHYAFFSITALEVPCCFKFSIDGKVKLIAPLCRVYKGREKPYTTFGSSATIASQDFIYDKDISLEHLSLIIKMLISYCGKLTIWNIMTTSKTNEALQLLGYTPIKQFQSVRIPILNGYQYYFNSLSKNARQNVRTAYNRIAKDGLRIDIQHFRGG